MSTETADQQVEAEVKVSLSTESESTSADSSTPATADPANIHYEGDKCIYTDPSSKAQFVWDEEKKSWDTKEAPSTASRPQGVSTDDYEFDGNTYSYTDKSTNVKYKWDKEKNEWATVENTVPVEVYKSEVVKVDVEEDEELEEGEEKKLKTVIRKDMSKGSYDFEGDTHVYTDVDGCKYVWDRDKNAWFPKVDDDFLATYQMSYGFDSPEEAAKKLKEQEEEEKARIAARLKEMNEAAAAGKRKQPPAEPTWFDVNEKTNTKVYVSNLPLDITEQEFVDLMQKCGLVMKDVDTGKMKIKLYTEPGSDELKGDGLCTYIKVESVELALKVLDGYDIRGKKIRIERAKFTMKGNAYDPSLKPKKKRRKDKEKIKKMQEKLFDWRPEKMRGERPRNERVVIVKNLFDPVIFDKDPTLILEYQQDIRDECKKCGDVRRVTLYDRHPEGVAQINFKEFEAADACIQLLNNRWFGKRQITAQAWDGKTKYKVMETEEEIQARLDKWDKYLETDDKEKKERAEKEKADRDSDQDTRSSAGSQDETDEEA